MLPSSPLTFYLDSDSDPKDPLPYKLKLEVIYSVFFVLFLLHLHTNHLTQNHGPFRSILSKYKNSTKCKGISNASIANSGP